jgi:hypothetical protein
VELLHELSNPNTNGLVLNRVLNVAEAFDTTPAGITQASA